MRLLVFVALVAMSSASLAPLFEHDEKIAGEYIVVMKVNQVVYHDKSNINLHVDVMIPTDRGTLS